MTDAPIIASTLPPVEGVDAAHDAWGCTCAPVALAAALGRSLDEVRPAVSPGGRFRGYMLPERSDERVAVDWIAQVGEP